MFNKLRTYNKLSEIHIIRYYNLSIGIETQNKQMWNPTQLRRICTVLTKQVTTKNIEL